MIHKILIVFLTVFVLLASYVIISIMSVKPYTISSEGAKSVDEKIRRLGKRVDMRSQVLDIEYRCWISPSSFGPSTHDYRVAVKVAPADVPKWLETFEPSSYDTDEYVVDGQGVETLNLSGDTWRHTSAPKSYRRGTNAEMVVYKPEGIIIMHLLH